MLYQRCPTKYCSKCSERLDYTAFDSLAYCEVCRWRLHLPGAQKPANEPLPASVYRDKQLAEKIPYVLPVERWPEIRKDIPRGPSRYDSTLKYFAEAESKRTFLGAAYYRSAA